MSPTLTVSSAILNSLNEVFDRFVGKQNSSDQQIGIANEIRLSHGVVEAFRCIMLLFRTLLKSP